MTTVSESQCKAARVAGALYLLMAISAPFALIYIPSTLIVPGDATATADRFRASESLLRIGIGMELFHQAVAIFLVLALYRLFKAVNENQAMLMVILGAVVSVPIVFLNVLNEIAALVLVSGADFLSVPGKPLSFGHPSHQPPGRRVCSWPAAGRLSERHRCARLRSKLATGFRDFPRVDLERGRRRRDCN